MKNILTAIILLALIVGVIGYSRGWLEVKKSNVPGRDEVEVGVTVDKGKARQDLDAAKARVEEFGSDVKEKTQELGQEVRERTGDAQSPAAERTEQTKLSGTIRSVDATARTLNIDTASGPEAVKVADSAAISVDGKPGALATLKAGDRVTLLLDKDDPGRAIDVDVVGS